MMESDNIITPNEAPVQRKYNRREIRAAYGGKRSRVKSKAPRDIASRKVKPMPENWQGWRFWKPTKRKAV